MTAILFALVAYVGWGTGDIFGAIASRKVGSYTTSVWSFLFRLVIFGLFIPFFITELKHLTPQLLYLNLFLGFLLITGLTSLNEGLRIGNPSIVGTIGASYAALAVVFSLIIFRETLSLAQILAIFPIFIGVILVTLDFKTLSKAKNILGKGTNFAILAAIVWGIYFTFIRIPVHQLGWFWASYIAYIPVLIIFITISFLKKKIVKPSSNSLLPIILSSVVFTAGDFGYNFALSKGLNSVVAPVAGSYPTLFVLLAFLVFKEPVTKQQIIGIVTTLIGVVLLSILSV